MTYLINIVSLTTLKGLTGFINKQSPLKVNTFPVSKSSVPCNQCLIR